MRCSALGCRSFALGLTLAVGSLAAGQGQAPPATTRSEATQQPAPAGKPGRPAPRRAQPAMPSTLEVTVVGPTSQPVEGAFVMALPAVGAYFGMQLQVEKLRSGITGKDGRVRLEQMPTGPWSVTVQARGFLSATESRVNAATLNVKLDKGGAISGLILDGGTKAPVAGARVALEAGMPLPGDWQDRLARNEALSDAKGVFRLEGVGRGAVTVVARAPGYAPATRTDARAGARLELFLFPGPTLSGTVRDDAGKPVAGASMHLFAQGWSTPPPVDPTDAGGRFTAAGIEPGEYWIVARAGARAPGLAQVVVTERDDAGVDLALGEGGYVTGRTVDDSGRPIAAASVRPEAFGGRGLPQLVSDTLVGTSREDGSFALGPLPAGAFSFVVSHRGHATQRVSATVAALQSSDLRDVVLEAGLAIRGEVRDREGAGLAGVLVRAEPRGGGEGPNAEAESDAAGAFALSGLSAGAYSLSAEAVGYARGRASATAGGEPVVIVLDSGGTITGRVVDAAGQPVDGATVSGESVDDDPAQAHAFVHATTGQEGDGRFTIRDAAPATYALRIYAAGAGRGSLTGVKTAAGRVTDVGTIALGASGTVRGVVVDVDGQGVPGATIRVRPDVHSSYSDDPSAQTDSSGAFEAQGVRPGRVDVVVTHPAYVSSRLSAVEVDPEKEPQALQIVLTRGGRIEGRARRREGRPFDDGRVMVSPVAGNAGYSGEPAPTLTDGSFVIEHVPAGRVMVSLMTRVASHPQISGPPGMTILVGVASREIEVREGEMASVDFVTRDVVVAGRVTRGGQGLPGVVVNVTSREGGAMSGFMGMSPTALAPPSGPPLLTATTREDGSYELLVFAPGKSFVQMRPAERQAFPGRELDIPDVERYELDLEVGEATVSGVVVDKDSGAPLPEVQVALREPGTDGKWKGGGASGADGRFTIAAEPGEYVLEANSRSRRKTTLPVSLGSGGLADVRLEMEAGLEVRGRVLDAAGRAVPEVSVVAVEADGSPSGPYGERSLPDGSFRLGGLDTKPYTLLSGAERVGFAMRTGVTPGGDPVTLTLRPGGRVLARILGPDGAPVKDVGLHVAAWDGVRARYLPGEDTHPTETPGVFEMSVPAGSLEIEAGWPKPLGRAVVRVVAEETASVEIVLKEMPAR